MPLTLLSRHWSISGIAAVILAIMSVSLESRQASDHRIKPIPSLAGPFHSTAGCRSHGRREVRYGSACQLFDWSLDDLILRSESFCFKDPSIPRWRSLEVQCTADPLDPVSPSTNFFDPTTLSVSVISQPGRSSLHIVLSEVF